MLSCKPKCNKEDWVICCPWALRPKCQVSCSQLRWICSMSMAGIDWITPSHCRWQRSRCY